MLSCLSSDVLRYRFMAQGAWNVPQMDRNDIFSVPKICQEKGTRLPIHYCIHQITLSHA